MVHAIESFTSKNSNQNPLSPMLAREALRMLSANIEIAVFEVNNVDGRSAMLLGSTLAGQALANLPVAAVHALAYPIGGMFHIPHGLSNGLMLPHVLHYNAPSASYLYAELSEYTFHQLRDETSIERRCEAFVESMAELSTRLGLQSRLCDVVFPRRRLGLWQWQQ